MTIGLPASRSIFFSWTGRASLGKLFASMGGTSNAAAELVYVTVLSSIFVIRTWSFWFKRICMHLRVVKPWAEGVITLKPLS